MITVLSKNKARLTVSINSGKNRRRKSKIVTFTGKKDLENKYREFEQAVKHSPLSDISVEDLILSYIKNAEIRKLSVNTIKGYEAAANRIIERFKGVLAKDLTTYQIDEFIADMAEKYTYKTIANTIFPLNAAYQRAIRTGQLNLNPCTNATLPKKQKKEITTLPPEQIQSFIEELEKQRLDLRVGYELCLMCGLRRGEVLGLRESDVNLNFKQISIKRARYCVKGQEYLQDPKTARSKRTLALPERLACDIDMLIKEHHSEPFDCSDFLIQDGFGNPINPSTFTAQVTRIERAAGLSHVTAHGLRHTFASLLNSANVDIARISAELGHSNITTPLNIDTHVFGDAQASSREIAETIDNAINEMGNFRATPKSEKIANR